MADLQLQELRNQNALDVANIYAQGNINQMQIQNQGRQNIQQAIGQNLIDVQTLRNEGNINQQLEANSSFQKVAQINQETSLMTAFQKGQSMENVQSLKNLGAESLSSMNFAQNLKLTGIGFGVDLIGKGINYLTANALLEKQAELQRQNFDYMSGKVEQSYQQAGLPTWLAFNPSGASFFPKQSQNLTGSNFFSSALPGNTSGLAWTGSSSQLALGVGQVPDV